MIIRIGGLANNGVNLAVRPVTGRACARPAPDRPAGYAIRSTDLSSLSVSFVLGVYFLL